MKFSHCLFIFAVTFFSCSEKVEPQPEGIPDPVVLMDSVIYHVTESDTLQMNLYSLDIHENLQQDVIMIVHGGGFYGRIEKLLRLSIPFANRLRTMGLKWQALITRWHSRAVLLTANRR